MYKNWLTSSARKPWEKMADTQSSSSSIGGSKGNRLPLTTITRTSLESTQPRLRLNNDNTGLTGSVFLINSEGETLNLPVPANDSHDPLNWTSKKRAISFAVLLVFATVSLVTVLGPSMLFQSLAKDFPPKVSNLARKNDFNPPV